MRVPLHIVCWHTVVYFSLLFFPYYYTGIFLKKVPTFQPLHIGVYKDCSKLLEDKDNRINWCTEE